MLNVLHETFMLLSVLHEPTVRRTVLSKPSKMSLMSKRTLDSGKGQVAVKYSLSDGSKGRGGGQNGQLPHYPRSQMFALLSQAIHTNKGMAFLIFIFY